MRSKRKLDSRKTSSVTVTPEKKNRCLDGDEPFADRGTNFFDTTVTSEKYLEFINEFVNSFLINEMDEVEFQQDGARVPTCTATMDRLYELFPPHKIISNQKWPPMSPDLSVLNNFLWSYLKNNIYKSNPQTINELKINIVDYILIR